MVRVLSNTKLQLVLARLDAGDHHDVTWAKTGVSVGSISKVHKIHCPNLPKAKGGHPRKLGATARCRAVHLVRAGSAQTTKAATQQLENTLGTSTSTRTVQRMLVEEGLEAVTKKPNPNLTKDHVQACLELAERHQHWTLEDWMREGLGMEKAWGGAHKLTSGGDCGPGYATKLNNRLTKELYVEVEDLEDELMASLEYYGKDMDDFMFMHDNASSHTGVASILPRSQSH
ncbi:hypothetical protein OPQ81_011338 [Rhizoctonia solani]|nr:hypothetical protein OPQ81_011338 [Rhizoctonia solani]